MLNPTGFGGSAASKVLNRFLTKGKSHGADSLWEIEIMNDEGRLGGPPFFILNTPSLRGTPLEEGNDIVGTPLTPLVKGGNFAPRFARQDSLARGE